MEIVNIIQCTNLGGMERASLRLTEALRERGHLIEWISLNQPGPIAPLLSDSGVPCQFLTYDKSRMIFTFWAQLRAFKRVRMKAVLLTGHNVLAQIALSFTCPVSAVLAIHFHHKGVKSVMHWRLIYLLALFRFQAITFPCEFIRDEAIAILPWLAQKATIVRNPLALKGIVKPEVRREAKRRLGFRPESILIGNLGWLITRKRFDVFLETVAACLRMGLDVDALIAGDGPEKLKLMELAEALGISDRVKFIGAVVDTDAVYECIDILLFNTDWDAFPTTPLEAISHGIPVVASCLNSGLCEVYDPSSPLLPLTAHSIKDLVDRIQWVSTVSDRSTLVSMERQWILQHCNSDTIAGQVETLFARES